MTERSARDFDGDLKTLSSRVDLRQGVKRLAERFEPMAFAPDGLIEAFYDPDVYNPEEGKFIVGLQFHPERMRHEHDTPSGDLSAVDAAEERGAIQESVFDYPECPRAYQCRTHGLN